MPGIWMNEDNSHYFFKRGEKASDMEHSRNFILQYKGTNVTRMILNGNSQKTSFETKAGVSGGKDEFAKVYANGTRCRYKGAFDTGNPKPVYAEYAWDIPEGAFKDGYQVM